MKFNFGVSRKDIKFKGKDKRNMSTSVSNEILLKMFLKKWKKSGIIKELREKRYHESKGERSRRKRNQAKKRQQNSKRN
tara:strand:- start:59 stop:295 length:237 start_codon:yes stop_codon:yes gene_type:complete